jgi:hypothetical protein
VVIAEHAPAELELLVLCARATRAPAQAERVAELLQARLDWTRFIALAQRHAVVPLVWRSLGRVADESVPRAVRDHLRAASTGIALRNRAMAAELVDLLDVLDRLGIPAIPYKGPVLAAAVYGDLALRPCGDLDLLVRRHDGQAAAQVLFTRGFELVPPFHDPRQVAFVKTLRGDRLRRFVHGRSEHHFVRPRGQLLVDLHLRLADTFIRFGLGADELLGRTEPFTLASHSVRNLQPEDLLLVLCLNAAKDAWSQLLRLCDIAELLRAFPGLDWQLVHARAETLGVVRLLRISLNLAAELLGAPPASTVLPWLSPDRTADQLTRTLRHRLLTDAAPRAGNVNLDYARFMASVRERRRDRAWLFLDLIFTPGVADWRLVRLPAWLSPVYYGVRLLRLAGTTVRNSSRLASRSPHVSE